MAVTKLWLVLREMGDYVVVRGPKPRIIMRHDEFLNELGVVACLESVREVDVVAMFVSIPDNVLRKPMKIGDVAEIVIKH